MKKLLIVVIVLFTINVTCADGPADLYQLSTIEPGFTATVEEVQWVTVMNLKSRAGFKFGDKGIISPGSTVSVIARDEETGYYLVEYLPHAGEISGGTSLPIGAIFFLSDEKLRTMTSRYEDNQKKEQTLRAKIARLLQKNPQY
jgi:uncharacterized protein YgiM (DUF1202 family)